jgi:hypothetical protein
MFLMSPWTVTWAMIAWGIGNEKQPQSMILLLGWKVELLVKLPWFMIVRNMERKLENERLCLDINVWEEGEKHRQTQRAPVPSSTNAVHMGAPVVFTRVSH